MSNMKRSMRRVFWLLALCFFLLLGYLGKLVFVDREEISGNSYNSRLRYVDETIKRGDILDREGEVIATSTRQEDGTYKREYPRGRMAAHITGYSSVGKTGVEAAENFELLFGIQMAWGISKFLLTIVILPLILIGMVVGGLLYIAFPILIVIGIITLLCR